MGGIQSSSSSSKRSNKSIRPSTHPKSSHIISGKASWTSSSGTLARSRDRLFHTQYHQHERTGSAKQLNGTLDIAHQTHRQRSPSPEPTRQQQRDEDDDNNNDDDGNFGIHQSSYFLPDNWDTEDRFFSAHVALKQLFGDIAAGPVLRKLRQPGCQVLELGCGNGPWLMDAASQYQRCHFIGVENPTVLANTPPTVSFLDNVSFEPIDLNADTMRLPFPDHSIDVIYGRSLGYRFDNAIWVRLMQEIRRVVKPDGVIQLLEAYFMPKGTFLIDSFMETTKKSTELSGRDFELAVVLSQKAERLGFRVVERKWEEVHMGRQGGRLGKEFMAVVLRAFNVIFPAFGPSMKLDEEEYAQRVEMFCAQCVQHNAKMDWYSYVLVVDS